MACPSTSTGSGTYGGVSSESVLGITLIIVHDMQAAHDLLEQAAAKILGLPMIVMANKPWT
jgi:hypothetical protein